MGSLVLTGVKLELPRPARDLRHLVAVDMLEVKSETLRIIWKKFFGDNGERENLDSWGS